ncbi:conserved hypothetical protein [Methylocella silvestris BL2]|uniref:Uncharacterized protein n=1 Tax=Methylocella silvestris (strain DSM 15510 / CIP 108128 / LMG 27833 / NCIMB 13906 / BL2) TaxID=395965 RepID=B8ES42_METSB|nr:hypothetical protein [Methylocella silvestris]ACK52257.1 conserved hypothetical protein [Methylocella silvestris BL2]
MDHEPDVPPPGDGPEERPHGFEPGASDASSRNIVPADGGAPHDGDGDAEGEIRADDAGEDAEHSTPGGEHGGGLRPVDAGLSDLAPFFATREQEPPPEPPAGKLAAFINYGSSAAFVLAVLGFAFAAGTYFFGGNPGTGSERAASDIALRESADRAELLRKTQAMVTEIGALKANVEALRVSVAQAQSGKDQRGVEKSVDALKAKVDSIKTDTSAALAELSTKVDKLQRDPGLKQVADRLNRIEKQTALPTGSIAPIVKAATQEQKNAPPKSQPAADAGARLQLITSWVVREVYDGVALIENARGSMEVAIGDQIPGAGTVKSIERRGGGWIVVTSRGLVDYDHSILVP